MGPTVAAAVNRSIDTELQMKSGRPTFPGLDCSNKWNEDRHSTKEMKSLSKTTTGRKSDHDTADHDTAENKQRANISNQLKTSTIKQTDSRGATSKKRSTTKNSPVSLTSGKTHYRPTDISNTTDIASRPPGIIQGKSIYPSATIVKHNQRRVKHRAVSDITLHDIYSIGECITDSPVMEVTNIKSILPPVVTVLASRRALSIPRERLRPLAIPTTEIGSSKIFTSRKPVSEQLPDTRTRVQKQKRVIRRRKTCEDVPSELTHIVQGVTPKMTYKNPTNKQIDITKVSDSSSTDLTTHKSSGLRKTISRVQKDSCVDVKDSNTEKNSSTDEKKSWISSPIFISENITPIEQQTTHQTHFSKQDGNTLPVVLPNIYFRPATPVPSDYDIDDPVGLTSGRLLQKTVYQGAIRKKEFERLAGDIKEVNELNHNLQSQFNVVEG